MATGHDAVLPHEAWHVVQQRRGRVARSAPGGRAVNADPALEREADTMGARALTATGRASPAQRSVTREPSSVRTSRTITQFADPDRVAFNTIKNGNTKVPTGEAREVPAAGAWSDTFQVCVGVILDVGPKRYLYHWIPQTELPDLGGKFAAYLRLMTPTSTHFDALDSAGNALLGWLGLTRAELAGATFSTFGNVKRNVDFINGFFHVATGNAPANSRITADDSAVAVDHGTIIIRDGNDDADPAKFSTLP